MEQQEKLHKEEKQREIAKRGSRWHQFQVKSVNWLFGLLNQNGQDLFIKWLDMRAMDKIRKQLTTGKRRERIDAMIQNQKLRGVTPFEFTRPEDVKCNPPIQPCSSMGSLPTMPDDDCDGEDKLLTPSDLVNDELGSYYKERMVAQKRIRLE